jgi:hypothetical protein
LRRRRRWRTLRSNQHVNKQWKCEKSGKIVMNDCQIRVRKVANEVGTSIGSFFLMFWAWNEGQPDIFWLCYTFCLLHIIVGGKIQIKYLKAIPKIEFEKCFKDWQKLWHKCIVTNGNFHVFFNTPRTFICKSKNRGIKNTTIYHQNNTDNCMK